MAGWGERRPAPLAVVVVEIDHLCFEVRLQRGEKSVSLQKFYASPLMRPSLAEQRADLQRHVEEYATRVRVLVGLDERSAPPAGAYS